MSLVSRIVLLLRIFLGQHLDPGLDRDLALATGQNPRPDLGPNLDRDRDRDRDLGLDLNLNLNLNLGRDLGLLRQ